MFFEGASSWIVVTLPRSALRVWPHPENATENITKRTKVEIHTPFDFITNLLPKSPALALCSARRTALSSIPAGSPHPHSSLEHHCSKTILQLQAENECCEVFPGALWMKKGGSLNRAQFIPNAQDLSEPVLLYPANIATGA
jgi:hypothetical protein